MTTLAPCAASASTMAFPMPLLPPVTIAALPCKLIVPFYPGREQSGPRQRQLRRAGERLQHDAVTLGRRDQLVDHLGGLIGPEVEDQADALEADRRVLVDPECSPKVEVSFGAHGASHIQPAGS